MVKQGEKQKYDLNKLRGWQRDQLKLLKEFATKPLVSQTILSGASGLRAGSHALGGKMTALTRNNLITKAGKDKKESWYWQLNDDEIDPKELKKFLKKLGI